MSEWDETAWLVVGACALALATLVALLAVRAASRREVAAARTEAAELRRRLDELERAVDDRAQQAAIEPVVVARPVGRPEVVLEPTVVEGRLFADLVLRESVVKAASWVHGVRRALSPENRNRIAFEVRREVKRARKSRRAEMQEALRAHRARERAAGAESEDAA